MRAVLMVALVVGWAAGVTLDGNIDLPRQKVHHRENATLFPQKTEGFSNKAQSGVKRVRKARKINTNFFSSSVTTPLLNAMKSTLKLFQNPFKKASKRKTSQKPIEKSKQAVNVNVKNKSLKQEVLIKRPIKRVTIKKGNPQLRKSIKPHQSLLKTRTPIIQKQVGHRPTTKKVHTKIAKQLVQIKPNTLRKHHPIDPHSQQILQNTKYKPASSHFRPTTPIRPSTTSITNQVTTSDTGRLANHHPHPHRTGSNNHQKKPQEVPIKTSKHEQPPQPHVTRKRKVQPKDNTPSNLTPLEVTQTNKTVVKQLIVELHDKIHDVLRHQNIPNQNQSLPPVINGANTKSSDAKIVKNPIVHESNKTLKTKPFQSQKIASIVKSIKSLMEEDQSIQNTQTNFISNPVIIDTQTNFKQNEKEQSRFEPFIPKFKTIENQTPKPKKFTNKATTPITSSTVEQEFFKNVKKAELERSNSAKPVSNQVNFHRLILTEPPSKKFEKQRPVKDNLVDITFASDFHKSDPIIRKSDNQDTFNKGVRRHFDSGPNSMEDCNQLVSDCYEKLLDRKIVELQNQMQRMEMKYWGNKV